MNSPMVEVYQNVTFRKQDRHCDEFEFWSPAIQKTLLQRKCATSIVERVVYADPKVLLVKKQSRAYGRLQHRPSGPFLSLTLSPLYLEMLFFFPRTLCP